MPLTQLHVSGYRSVRDLKLPLCPVNVITGANGTGKSNLYQALMLVTRAAQGQLARAVSEEGGTPSVLWAGGERIRYTRKQPVRRFCLGIQTDSFDFSFAVGLPSPSSLPPGRSLFGSDPEVKEEKLSLRTGAKSVLMLDRRGPTAWLRNAEGRMDEYVFALLKYESVLPQIVDPHRYPEVYLARQTILSWRFYHQFRTDASSPLRSPQIGVQTNVLSPDGSDLAAALETIMEVGDESYLSRALYGLWACHTVSGAHCTALATAEQLMGTAAASGNTGHMMVAHRLIGVCRHNLGDQESGRAELEAVYTEIVKLRTMLCAGRAGVRWLRRLEILRGMHQVFALLAAASSTTDRTVKLFPQPGPPVSTEPRAVSASRTACSCSPGLVASRWLSSAPTSRAEGTEGGDGRRPRGSAASRSLSALIKASASARIR